ncbi:MAG: M28 family peptidase [Hyphomicrobiales bacterium]
MADATIDRLAGAVSAPAMMRHLEEFARRVKLSGTPEELESFRYLQSRLDSYGLKTDLILHDAYISLPGKARLEIGNLTPDCITHSFSCSSPPEGVRGKLVYAGSGGPKDFAGLDVRGKIVLLEHIANPAASLRASEAGAAGQIHISPHKHLHEMCISPVWGSPTEETIGRLPSTVVLSVRQADGDALKRRVSAGEEVVAVLHAEVDTGWRKTPILVAELARENAAEDEPFVMFSGHHDTWHLGVMDNGGANATMLEVARLMAPERARLRRGLRLCFWSGHSHGRYSGSSWYADNRWEELAERCAVHVNVDSTGAKGNTVMTDALSSSELYGLAAEAVQRQGNQTLDGHRMSRAGDQSFWGIGVPSIFMGMGEQPLGSDDNVVGAILGGTNRKAAGFGWWWHTPDDTLDKMDPELLVRDTRVYVHAIWRLLTDRILPLDYAAHAEALARELDGLEAKLKGRFDLEPLARRVRKLRDSAASLKTRAAGAVSDTEAARINASLMAVSRAMVPMDYTSGNRFEPDPALGQSAYPVLDPLRRLAGAAGSDEAHFIAVAAKRASNRLAFALDQADAALGV